MRQIDSEAIKEILAKRVAAMGSQKQFAKLADVSESYLSDVLRGARPVGDRILEALHFERVVTYRRKA